MRTTRVSPFLVILSFVIIGSIGIAPAQSQSQAAELSVVPYIGPADATVRALGSDFDSATCGVEIFLDSATGTSLGTAGVTGGEFATDILIPAGTQDGAHPVVAVGLLQDPNSGCSAPSGEQASATYTVGTLEIGPFEHGPVTPFVQDLDLSTLPTLVPWKEGDPVRVGPGQEEP
ncbi:MAG TPA: hypothetical protein VNI57_14855, partial [Candidatus Saccharimonadales bacterium]|nr:hypothetical protein [Candidatus Saccharimonadales bacterium]